MQLETIKEKLRKILALAEQGEQGEAAAAQRLLTAQLDKYGLTMSDLSDELHHNYEIGYGVGIDYNLVIQVARKLNLDMYKLRWADGKMVRHKLAVCCTPAVYADLVAHLDHYRAVWEAQMKEFFHAFCWKHGLVGTSSSSSDDDDEPMTEETLKKLERLRAMMAGMEERELHKRLSDGDGVH